ncbi:MAG: type II secretion system minor pseudopilin GspJ [Magnetococcales bacterium]|nr:type II secretion system minor pseudopilin GspJ [Magnetococcales bacterium]
MKAGSGGGLSDRGGFTLLELLAALAVFAVMSVMAYGGLNGLLDVRQHGMKRMESLAAMRTFFMYFAQDVEQSVPRGVRDGHLELRPALIGADGAERFLELTRGGRANPRGVVRSALERVAYSLEEGRLLRRAWPVLDRVREEEPEGEVLLEEVTEVEIRFLGGDGKWSGLWPASPGGGAPLSAPGADGTGRGGGEPGAVVVLPRAVEIVVLKSGWGRIRRLFEIAGGG